MYHTQYKLPMSFYLTLFIVLVVANISVYRAIFAPRVLTVTVFKVGPVAKQVNATLVHSPNNKTILIDTGPDASILRALGGALPMWQRKIDAVILTSTKKAFSGGLPEVQSRYRVTRTFSSDTSYSFDAVSITILAPGTLSISYGSSVLNISSSTPASIYISGGKTFSKK